MNQQLKLLYLQKLTIYKNIYCRSCTGVLKINHIKPVGLNSKEIKNIDINEIIKYFKRYANPINMFLLPKDIGGLGEIQEFIDEQKPLNIDKSVL